MAEECSATRPEHGTYRTAAGSTVVVSGVHGGIHEIWFDWFEERECCDARPTAEVCAGEEPRLSWRCSSHRWRATSRSSWQGQAGAAARRVPA